MDRGALRQLLVAATAAAGRQTPGTIPAGLPAASVAALVADNPGATVAALTEAARFHRVEGCVHESLRALPNVNPAALADLQSDRRQAMRRHMLTVQSLLQITEVLDAAGIPCLVVKGPVLASHLYRDAGLRTYEDLDLLVPQQAFAKAVTALELEGFAHDVRNWPRVTHYRAGELPLSNGTISLDLHWHLLYAFYDRRAFSLAPAAFFRHARTVPVGGHDVLTFDAVDTLLHLCFHAARSGAHRLIWLKDIERSLSVDRPDLDLLVARARGSQCGPPVGLALRRAKAVLGAPVPDEIIAALAPPGLRVADRLVMLTWKPERCADASLARLFARSTSTSLAKTSVELGRIAYQNIRSARVEGHRLDRTDPSNPNSLLYPAGREDDKHAFIESVARWT